MIKQPIFAQVTSPDNCPEGGCKINLPEVAADDNTIQALLLIVFGLAAAIAVLVIVIASFNLVLGGGDPEKIARSKKTIIFALVGLSIALTAEFIVLTVLGRL